MLNATTSGTESQFMNSGQQNGTDNSDYLIEYVKISNTPFEAVLYEGKWRGMFGKYMVVPPQETKEGVAEYINNNQWEVIGAFAIALMMGRDEAILQIQKDKGIQ